MKKITIIQLLNKIANGEEVPKEIRIDHWCYKFKWVDHLYNYYDEEADIDLTSVLSLDREELNYGVEILDEFEDITLFGEPVLEELEKEKVKLEVLQSYMYLLAKDQNALIKNQKKIIERIKEE